MKKQGFLTILLVLAGSYGLLRAQTPALNWEKHILGSTGIEEAHAGALDAEGNFFLTGYFDGIMDMDPDTGSYFLEEPVFRAVFIEKLDKDGHFLWAGSFAGGYANFLNDIQVDTDGNAILYGVFEGTTDFDPGPGIYTMSSKGYRDIFVLKISPQGQLLWARQFGSTNDEDGKRLAVAPDGAILLTGYFYETTQLAPGAATLFAQGYADCFIMKVDADGNFVWAKSFGGQAQEIPGTLALDQESNILICGFTTGQADFDPGPAVHMAGVADFEGAFVLKLSPVGDFMLVKSFGQGAGQVYIEHFAFGPAGEYVLSGIFSGTIDFDPGAASDNHTSNGEEDVFILKLNSGSDFLWARNFGSAFLDRPEGLQVDTAGNIFSCGIFANIVDFNPGAGVFNLTSAGDWDVFFQKLDKDGNYKWARKIGNEYTDYVYGLRRDALGNLYTTGTYSGTVDFNPGALVYPLNSKDWNSDIFALKLDASGGMKWAKSLGTATSSTNFLDQQVAPENGYYVCGIFSGVNDFNPGAGVDFREAKGAQDFFVEKLDAKGKTEWLYTLGSPGDERIRRMEITPDGNILIIGNFEAQLDFDPGSGTLLVTPAGDNNVFVGKYNASFQPIWVQTLANASFTSIAESTGGEILVCGLFGGTVDFDPGPGVYSLTATGDPDAFVWALDANGNFQWVRTFSGSLEAWASDVVTSPGGDAIYVAGRYKETLNSPDGLVHLTGQGYFDIFLLKLDLSGNILWAKTMGGDGPDGISYFKCHSDGSLFVVGTFYNAFDADPGPGIVEIVSQGDEDMFFCKLDPEGNLLWVRQIGNENSNYCQAVDVDPMGNLFASGNTLSTLDIDPSDTGSYQLYIDPWSFYFITYVLQLDADGNFVKAAAVSCDGEMGSEHLLITPEDNVLISGYFRGTTDFDPGPDTVSSFSIAASAYLMEWAWNGSGIFTPPTYPNIKVFPNPGAGQFTVQVESAETVHLMLYDVQGRIVWQQTATGTDKIQARVNALPGAYRLVTRSRDGILGATQLIIQ